MNRIRALIDVAYMLIAAIACIILVALGYRGLGWDTEDEE